MKVLSLNLSHNASCTVIEDGDIILSVEEERLSKRKKDHNIDNICFLLKNQFFDYIYYTSFNIDQSKKEYYKNLVLNKLLLNKITFKEIYEFPYHHLTHAFSSFYNSGYKEAICLIIDNGGVAIKAEEKEFGQEILSIYRLNYTEEPENLLKICRNENGETFSVKNLYSVNTISIAGVYELFKNVFNYSEPGSIMGLSCYGKNVANMKIFKQENDYFLSNINSLYFLIIESNVYLKENVCYTIQKDCTDLVYSYLEKIKKYYLNIPICVSGGFFQNCVANYQFLKKGVDIFVDPISHDGGTSIGLAQYAYLKHSKNKKINKYSNLYLGPNIEYANVDFNTILFKDIKFKFKKVKIKEVALLLKNRKSIGIFQGRSEIGPRALGNRSILFDPSDPLAKEKINLIKKREWFRPFAGTVLDEYKHEWFNLYSKESVDYMSYALDIKEDKTKLIPGICHIDNTCRAQTLKEKDNYIFYNLIKEFYNLTSIPILLNTSLNKSGRPLVEDLNDLLDFLESTPIDYIYLPEKETLLYK
jgi:carbamoyltransferase